MLQTNVVLNVHSLKAVVRITGKDYIHRVQHISSLEKRQQKVDLGKTKT